MTNPQHDPIDQHTAAINAAVAVGEQRLAELLETVNFPEPVVIRERVNGYKFPGKRPIVECSIKIRLTGEVGREEIEVYTYGGDGVPTVRTDRMDTHDLDILNTWSAVAQLITTTLIPIISQWDEEMNGPPPNKD